MENKMGKKIEITTRKRKASPQKHTILPIMENPFEVLDDVNRMYNEDPWIKPWWNHLIINQALGLPAQNRFKLIPVDMVDSGEEYQIYTELPGINKKDIEITLTPTMITICGATETNIQNKTIGYIRRERGYSTLCRYLRFPEDINPDTAEAILSDGILQINVRKKKPVEKKRIPIKYLSKNRKISRQISTR